MANTNERKTGPTEVEQVRDGREIVDGAKDIENKRPKKEITEKDLDRGEELYTGFGFGNIVEPGKIKQAKHSTSTKYSEEESVDHPIIKKEEGLPLVADEKLVYTSKNSEASKREAVVNEDIQVIEVPETKKLPGSVLVDDEEASVSSEKVRIESSSQARADFDPTDERKVHWQEPNRIKTSHTVTTRVSGDWQEVGREKVVDSMPIETDTRLVIEPSEGEVVYRESQMDARTHASPARRVSLDRQRVGDLLDNPSYKNIYLGKQVPDYELADVHYAYERDNKYLYKPVDFVQNTYQVEVLPIKKHYKSQAKQKKKNAFPWGKIVIGAAATLGAIGLINHLTEDDDGFFF